MNEPLHPEVAILNAALELPAGQRAAFLDEACAGDAALRQRVKELLWAHEQSEDFLETPPAGLDFKRTVRLAVPLTEKPGDKIGRYKLLQQIGEGGCGVVYMAEQEEPVRRRVALKVIKLGMDTRSVIARFEAERQALALMDHPNIAKVFDAGSTERPFTRPADTLSPVGGEGQGEGDAGHPRPSDGRGAGGEGISAGRPYFVMELVRGVKITDFCDENNVSTKERLKLFIQVCQAIQHAHQKGVIHRDIKPSNILVTVNDGVPVPKVIDFGIAKATQGRLTDHTLFTAFEQFIGTPAYMSPEQAVMTSLDIDTRSDIYSLGVLLYELLTGRTPFDQKELLAAGLDEMRRTIREVEPVKPSTRLTQELSTADKVGRVAPRAPFGVPPSGGPDRVNAGLQTRDGAHGVTRPASQLKDLIHALRGDLDWIVMKSLEKDRARRYETANGLAADILRHLNCEPVVARPPSRLYEFQKTVRRHKFGFAAAAAVVTVLAVGVIASTWEAVRATHAEREQVQSTHRAEQGERQAREAETHATDELWHSYVAQARAARFSGQPGRRFDSLAVLAKARAIRFAPELRDEAIACLALPDFKLLRSVSATQGVFDGDLQRYAMTTTNLGDISIRRVSDDQEEMILPNPPGTVWYIGRFGPDGNWLPVLCLDHRIRVWDLKQRAVALDIPCATRHQGLDFHPHNQFVAVAAGRAKISIYQLATGKEVNSFPIPFAPSNVRYDPSGTKLAISSWSDNRLAILDANSGAQLMTLTNSERLGEVAWNPRDASLAVAGKNKLLFVWDSAAGRLLQTLKGHQSEPDAIAFNHDGDILISSGWDGTHLWNARAGEHLMRYPIVGGFESFAPDDRTYGQFCYHSKPSLDLMTFASGREARRWHANEEDSDNNHKFISFSSDGKWLAFGAGDFVKLFDARTGDLLATLPTGPAGGARFQKSGGGLLVSSERGLFLWLLRPDGEMGEFTIGPPEAVGSPGAWQQATLSENGQVFAAFHGDRIWTFDAETMRSIARTDPLGQRTICYLSLSPDGQQLATSGWHNSVVKIWDSRTGAQVKELVDPEWIPDACPNPAFEPTGRSLIIACGVHFRVWDAHSWTPGLRAARSDMNMIALSHQSGLAAMRNGQTSIQLLDMATGAVLATLQSPLSEFVLDFTFSPDDTQLAVTHTLTRELLVWDLRLIREQLAPMGLDWNRPPYPPAAHEVPAKPIPWRVLTEPLSPARRSPTGTGQ